jgi:hypothetical protein
VGPNEVVIIWAVHVIRAQAIDGDFGREVYKGLFK